MAIFGLSPFFSGLLLLFSVIVFSSLPLYLAVKFLGGESTILRVFLVNAGAGIVIALAKQFIGNFGSVIGFIILLFVYHNVFKMGFVRALLAWLLQFVIIAILIAILAAFGISGLI